MRDPQWCLAQAKAIGPACQAVIESMFGKGVLDYLRAAQGLLGLRERYTAPRLEAACARALSFGVPTYRTVKQILRRASTNNPHCSKPNSKRRIAAARASLVDRRTCCTEFRPAAIAQPSGDPPA